MLTVLATAEALTGLAMTQLVPTAGAPGANRESQRPRGRP
jgi:hypothetical protein